MQYAHYKGNGKLVRVALINMRVGNKTLVIIFSSWHQNCSQIWE